VSVTTPEPPWIGELPPTFTLVRHIVDFLQWQFSKLPVGAYRFSLNDDGAVDQHSEIHISADFPINPTHANQRPAITVFRSGAIFQGLSIGDLGYHNTMSGAKMLTDIVPTTLMVGVLSRAPVEAEALAWFVQRQISAYREAITKTLPGLIKFGGNVSLSPPSPPGAMVAGGQENWTAVIASFPAYLSSKVISTPLNRPIVNQFGLTMTTTQEPQTPAPAVVPLQGTAVMQPAPIVLAPGAALPQPTSSEAESTSPISVKIEAR
jgi:hypothetical protein